MELQLPPSQVAAAGEWKGLVPSNEPASPTATHWPDAHEICQNSEAITLGDNCGRGSASTCPHVPLSSVKEAALGCASARRLFWTKPTTMQVVVSGQAIPA